MGRRRLAALSALLMLAARARADEPDDARLGETLVVTATRSEQRASASPSPVTVIRRERILESKALDEALRDDPSFATFRRNSSLVADPSSQGVNLRGIGPSGVSRALVLEDGVPLNDGFGGWVYWASIPRLGLQRVEIAPGVGSSLYGSSALGGVIQLVSRPIGDRADVELQGGSFATALGSISLGKVGDAGGVALDLEGLTTGGYRVVASPGAIDHRASSRHGNGRLRIEAPVGDSFTAGLRLAGFIEDEDGGTDWTTALARQTDVALSVSGKGLDLRAFARLSRFDQNRAQILPDAFQRQIAQLAAAQSAPADEQGVSFQWHGGALTAGADLHRIYGRSIENFPAGSALQSRTAGGEQQQGGAFGEVLLQPVPWLQLQAAARLDAWRNLGGVRREVPFSGAERDTALGDRSDVQVNPRAGVRIAATDWIAVRGAAYKSFRAPTLNELYRPFQVGPVRTDANPGLGPETLLGAEAGFDVGRAGRGFQATAYLVRLDDPIVNVTTGVNQQMRQNLGATRVAGIELHVAWPLLRSLRAEAAWTWVRSRVLEGPTAGHELAQDPSHRITAGLAFDDPGLFSASVDARYLSAQFEDDRNTLRLPAFLVVDATVSKRFGERWTLFAAAENLFDRRYLTGLQGGVATVGQPLSLRAGLRLKVL